MILVTGGAGFIGSHVVDRLISGGYKVRVVDNLSSGKLANIKDHIRKRRVDFVEGDIRDVDVVKRAIKDMEGIVHLAAIVSIPHSLQNPVTTFDVNVKGTFGLLDSCLGSLVTKFIYFSSCAVYGEHGYLPIDEKHRTSPISPYAVSKLDAEHHCETFGKGTRLKTVILRPFNVYGPRQGPSEYSGVISKFLDRVANESPLMISGDGSQTRDFIHVSDVADCVLKTLECDVASGEIFNVGSGKSVAIKDLAETVLKIAGKRLVLVHEHERAGDTKHSVADISKARDVLGFAPKVSLEEGLRTLLKEGSGES